MTKTEAQTKLEKLARIEQGNRTRSKRFLEKIKKNGKKQISAIISGKAYNELNRLRDASIQAGTPSSFGQIIELALACYADNLRSKSGPGFEAQPVNEGELNRENVV